MEWYEIELNKSTSCLDHILAPHCWCHNCLERFMLEAVLHISIIKFDLFVSEGQVHLSGSVASLALRYLKRAMSLQTCLTVASFPGLPRFLFFGLRSA